MTSEMHYMSDNSIVLVNLIWVLGIVTCVGLIIWIEKRK